MRAALCVGLLVLVWGCKNKKAEEESSSDATETVTPVELNDYAKQFYGKPATVSGLKELGFKVISYDRNPVHDEALDFVTLSIQRVRIRDSITGKVAWYTRVRLKSKYTPGDPERNQPDQYTWGRVEMLP